MTPQSSSIVENTELFWNLTNLAKSGRIESGIASGALESRCFCPPDLDVGPADALIELVDPLRAALDAEDRQVAVPPAYRWHRRFSKFARMYNIFYKILQIIIAA